MEIVGVQVKEEEDEEKEEEVKPRDEEENLYNDDFVFDAGARTFFHFRGIVKTRALAKEKKRR